MMKLVCGSVIGEYTPEDEEGAGEEEEEEEKEQTVQMYKYPTDQWDPPDLLANGLSLTARTTSCFSTNDRGSRKIPTSGPDTRIINVFIA